MPITAMVMVINFNGLESPDQDSPQPARDVVLMDMDIISARDLLMLSQSHTTDMAFMVTHMVMVIMVIPVLLSQLLLAQLVSPVTQQELPMLPLVSHSVHEASGLLSPTMATMATPLLTVVSDTALLDTQVQPHLSSKTAHGVLASKM